MALEQLTLFTEDTLASLLVSPGSEEARKMTATSGRRLSEFYRKSDPVGLLVRMLLDTSVWGSTTCYLTWKAKVTNQSRLYFQLVPSTPHTDETECSLWPTPHANCHTGAGEKGEGGLNIQTAVKMWPTPRANDAEKRGNIADDPRNGLPAAVKLWPTPAASQDWKPVRPLAPSEESGKHGTMLVGAVGDAEPHNIGGYLNPEWVEVLMNFPPRWTEVD